MFLTKTGLQWILTGKLFIDNKTYANKRLKYGYLIDLIPEQLATSVSQLLIDIVEQ